MKTASAEAVLKLSLDQMPQRSRICTETGVRSYRCASKTEMWVSGFAKIV